MKPKVLRLRDLLTNCGQAYDLADLQSNKAALYGFATLRENVIICYLKLKNWVVWMLVFVVGKNHNFCIRRSDENSKIPFSFVQVYSCVRATQS